ncbi:MAG: RNA polymerase sigma factor [Thermodesulfobacteriota bacterium]
MRVNNLEAENISGSNDYSNGMEYGIPGSDISYPVRSKVNLRLIKNYEDYSDNELVDLFVQDRDELAFNEIFNRYYQKTRKLALKILTDVDEAEDIVQEVFVTLLKSMNGFRGESKFSTWLYAISLNTIRMRLREKVKDRKSVSIDDDEYNKSLDNIVRNRKKNARLNSPEDININRQFVEKLHQALESLPEKYKEAFVLRNMKQLSNQEVADQLGVTLSAVKSRVHRARQYLKTNFSEY